LQGTLRGTQDGFISKLSPAGSSLVYSTYLGGSGSSDQINSIAVDGSGNTYVGGSTSSSDFPTTAGALRTVLSGGLDGFITKLNPAGDQLVYSTFVGGSSSDFVYAIAVDTSGRVYAAGSTSSTDFPTTASAIQVAKSAGMDAFLVKLSASGDSLVYSTLLGGTGDDWVFSVAIDGSGSAYVGGGTDSTDFPVVNPIQSLNAGGLSDAFVAVINAEGAGLLFSTYIGGSGGMRESVSGIGQQGGSVYGVGSTNSIDLRTANGLQTQPGGATDAFVFKISGIPSGSTLSLVPSSLDFGNQPVGSTSGAKTVTVTNTGGQAITIASIDVNAGVDFAQTNNCPLAPATLGGGSNCTIDVTFSPATAGSLLGEITITTDPPGSPGKIHLAGTGTSPLLSLSHTTLDFGNQLPTIVSRPFTVTLTNSGNLLLQLFNMTVSGEFSMSSTCGSTLEAGASCSLSVQFLPSGMGVRSGQLTIWSNAPGSPHTVALSGTGADLVMNLVRPSRPTRQNGSSSANLAQVRVASNGKADIAVSCSGAPSGTDCRVQPAVVRSGARSQTVSVFLTVERDSSVEGSDLTPGSEYPILVTASSGDDTYQISVPVPLEVLPLRGRTHETQHLNPSTRHISAVFDHDDTAHSRALRQFQFLGGQYSARRYKCCNRHVRV